MDFRSKVTFGFMGITGTSGNLKRDFAIIQANLNREILKIKHRTNKGLLLAAIEIRQDMKDKPPLIPVEYGNLKASFFIVTKKSADPSSQALQVKSAKFRKAETIQKLAKLREGHKEVLAQAQEELTPHDIGVMLGFSAYYAAPVHEIMGVAHINPGGAGAKFFQAAVYRNYDKILTIVKLNAQVRP